MTETTMTKQTAANNELLRQVKARMNGKIYKKTLQIVNEQGEESALEYLQQFFIQPIDTFFIR